MASPHWNHRFFAQLGNPAQLATLLDALPGAFFFAKDDQGRFTAINQALLDALGLADAQEVLGKTDYDFFDCLQPAQFASECTSMMSCSACQS